MTDCTGGVAETDSFSTNRLTDLPVELRTLEHLQIINLSMNKSVDQRDDLNATVNSIV